MIGNNDLPEPVAAAAEGAPLPTQAALVEALFHFHFQSFMAK